VDGDASQPPKRGRADPPRAVGCWRVGSSSRTCVYVGTSYSSTYVVLRTGTVESEECTVLYCTEVEAVLYPWGLAADMNSEHQTEALCVIVRKPIFWFK